MRIRVRDAYPADAEWMSDNTEGWTVTAQEQQGAASLDGALHALIAYVPRQGARVGWLYSRARAAPGDGVGYVSLYELYVAPDFRGIGVARALVEELFARVPDQEIVLSAWDRALYEMWLSLGFTYVPAPGERLGERGHHGDMVRPQVKPWF
ncbi:MULTISPECIES: GNAT family N-acetyltransferase [Streptomyces]|uniref:GNAT family N-acetyltransferase n=1 Tax=Streptomyces TaxID=1883 RepID=UPI000FD67F96|nr:GNAT family N-acetyltransferase [Streptomyces sp. B29(2018)]